MKVFARAFWESSDPNSTCCKRPNFPSVDLKSFIRPDGGGPTRDDQKKVNSPPPPEMTWQEGQGGGTRWNPTQEQIGILEKLYTGGMRTPNAEQIEQVTAQLSKYGKIEGKNVFYWFQNHKARERQKQKRVSSTSLLSLNFHTPTISISISKEDLGRDQEQASTTKRKCRSTWTSLSNEDGEEEEEVGHKKTLKLFPLHPEGRSIMGVPTV